MGMVEDYSKVILLSKKVIKNSSSGDHITDYTFKNTFCPCEDLIAEVQRLENALSVQKGTEKWIESTHDVIKIDEETLVVRFVFPFCG